MTTKHYMVTLVASVLSMSAATTRQEMAFSANDSITTLETKASHHFIGLTAVQIRSALDRAGYKDAAIISLDNEMEEGTILRSGDLHVIFTLTQGARFSLETGRVSFILQMQEGVCSQILRTKRFAK